MHISVTLLQQCLVTNHVQCKRWCPALSSFFLGNGVRAQMGSCLRLTLKNDSPFEKRLSLHSDCYFFFTWLLLLTYIHNIEEMAAEVSFLCNLYAIISERRLIQDSNIGVCVYRSDFLLTKSTTSEEVDIDDTGRNTIWFFDSEERFSNIGN